MGVELTATSFYDIPSVVDNQNLPFIMRRLDVEVFSFVTCLTPQCKEKFRETLRDFFTKKVTLEQAVTGARAEIVPPITYKQNKRWQERAVRSEISKIFTLGYGDYLLSIGETECFIPHTDLEEHDECLRLIAGKTIPIKAIQDNIYKNYGQQMTMYPTVPLHANCQHIITKCPKP